VNSPTALILTYHFYPSNEIGARRVTALARYLVGRGARVIVVSAFDGKPDRAVDELLPGVIAISVATPGNSLLDALVRLKRRMQRGADAGPDGAVPSGSHPTAPARPPRSANRVRDLFFRVVYFPDGFKRWTWRAGKVAVRAGASYEAKLIIASGPPHGALLAGAHAARKLGIPFVADLRDPWSDYLAAAHPERRWELRLLRALERWVIARAAAVTTTTERVAALLAGRYKSLGATVHVVRNGYDGGVAPSPPCTEGRLSILFAGELYVGRNPFPFLSALEWLLVRPDVDAARIEVTFMGNVAEYGGQSLPAWMAGKRCASVVRILPPESARGVAEAMSRSTVLLNLAQQQPLAVPAKTYEQLASGREVLLVCEDDCETARLVAGIRGVTQVDPGRPQALADALLDLYTRHVVAGRLTAPAEREVSKFSRTAANRRFHAVLASVAPLGSPEIVPGAQITGE
jgi:glycosyltransferase involved in cell wall biosynthesis